MRKQGELAKAVAAKNDSSVARRRESSELAARLNSQLDGQTLQIQTAGAAAAAAAAATEAAAQHEKKNSELKANMRADLGSAMAQVRKIQELKHSLAISQTT